MKILNFALFALAAAGAYCATTGVTANSDGALVRPSKATFAAQNNLVSQEVICVRVDMFAYMSGSAGLYWTDVELKVLDKDGNMIYFVSSSWSDRFYHKDHPELIDTNAKIAFYPFGNGISGVCAHKKVWLVQDGAPDYSAGTSIYDCIKEAFGISSLLNGFSYDSGISAVDIYPNLSGTVGGKSVREIFLNPDNSILISRKSRAKLERSGTDKRVWRPAVIQYYRAMPAQK